MKDEQNRLNWYYYQPSDGPEDRVICQYMRLDYLIRLLETHKYYVRRRREFDDANEKYENIKLAFPIAPAKKHDLCEPELTKRIIPYSDIIHSPTSCWTKNDESFLMWKSYATEVGACIKSTVHNLIASLEINLENNGINKVVCGSMNYKKILPSHDELSQLFDKDITYSDENEFRFYFYLSDDTGKKCTEFQLIPVNTVVLIDEIILSPFICKEAANKFARMIKCSYGIENVKQSKIKIK